VVEEVPTDLVPLYDRMVRQIQQLKRRDHEFCRLVLSTATLAYRPLHLLELGVLSGLPEQISGNTPSVVKIVNMCSSFLTIRDEYVYAIHQSAKDYLSACAPSAIFPAGLVDRQRSIIASPRDQGSGLFLESLYVSRKLFIDTMISVLFLVYIVRLRILSTFTI
jgi:hypothetical protein